VQGVQHNDRGDGYPANALIASFVFDVLERRGILKRTGLAATIRRISDGVPQHLVGDQRVASLAALRSLLDDPDARRVSFHDWFRT
jgi:hypothetical protein